MLESHSNSDEIGLLAMFLICLLFIYAIQKECIVITFESFSNCIA